MRESQTALWNASAGGLGERSLAAARVTNDFRILELWRIRHEHLMRAVADAAGRFGQPAKLRATGITLIERCALVDYLRRYHVVGRSRDDLILRWRRGDNPRRALLDVHEDYVITTSSGLCVDHLLHCLSDPMGPILLGKYREAFLAQYARFCSQPVDSDERPMDRATIPVQAEAARLKAILTARL